MSDGLTSWYDAVPPPPFADTAEVGVQTAPFWSRSTPCTSLTDFSFGLTSALALQTRSPPSRPLRHLGLPALTARTRLSLTHPRIASHISWPTMASAMATLTCSWLLAHLSAHMARTTLMVTVMAMGMDRGVEEF